MPELQRLDAGHADAVLAFELANRAYFAASVNDRGDEYFAHFAQRHQAQLADQDKGTCAFYVLVAGDGTILGRFNLYDIDDGTAELGYRVAERASGQGVATAAVRELCELAASQFGLHKLWALASRENLASQRVLAKTGFTVAGPGETPSGRRATWYQYNLPAAPPR